MASAETNDDPLDAMISFLTLLKVSNGSTKKFGEITKAVEEAVDQFAEAKHALGLEMIEHSPPVLQELAVSLGCTCDTGGKLLLMCESFFDSLTKLSTLANQIFESREIRRDAMEQLAELSRSLSQRLASMSSGIATFQEKLKATLKCLNQGQPQIRNAEREAKNWSPTARVISTSLMFLGRGLLIAAAGGVVIATAGAAGAALGAVAGAAAGAAGVSGAGAGAAAIVGGGVGMAGSLPPVLGATLELGQLNAVCAVLECGGIMIEGTARAHAQHAIQEMQGKLDQLRKQLESASENMKGAVALSETCLKDVEKLMAALNERMQQEEERRRLHVQVQQKDDIISQKDEELSRNKEEHNRRAEELKSKDRQLDERTQENERLRRQIEQMELQQQPK